MLFCTVASGRVCRRYETLFEADRIPIPRTNMQSDLIANRRLKCPLSLCERPFRTVCGVASMPKYVYFMPERGTLVCGKPRGVDGLTAEQARAAIQQLDEVLSDDAALTKLVRGTPKPLPLAVLFGGSLALHGSVHGDLIDELATVLARATTATVVPVILRLHGNRLGDKGVVAVGKLVAQVTAPPSARTPSSLMVQEIHLSHNKVTTRGAVALVKLLADCGAGPVIKGKSIRPLWLRLECNRLDPDVLRNELVELSCSYCECIHRSTHPGKGCGIAWCSMRPSPALHLPFLSTQLRDMQGVLAGRAPPAAMSASFAAHAAASRAAGPARPRRSEPLPAAASAAAPVVVTAPQVIVTPSLSPSLTLPVLLPPTVGVPGLLAHPLAVPRPATTSSAAAPAQPADTHPVTAVPAREELVVEPILPEVDSITDAVATMSLEPKVADADASAGAADEDTDSTVTLFILDSNAVLDMAAADTAELWKSVSLEGPEAVARLVGWAAPAASEGGEGDAGAAAESDAGESALETDDDGADDGGEVEGDEKAETAADEAEGESGAKAEATGPSTVGGAVRNGRREKLAAQALEAGFEGFSFVGLLKMLGSPPHELQAAASAVGCAEPARPRGNDALVTGRQAYAVLIHTVAVELDGLKKDYRHRRAVMAFTKPGSAKDACQAGGVLLELGADQAEQVVAQEGLDAGAALAPADARIVSVARLVAQQAMDASGAGAAARVVLVTGDRAMRAEARRAGVNAVDWAMMQTAVLEAFARDRPVSAGTPEADGTTPVFDGPWLLQRVQEAQAIELEEARRAGAGVLPGTAGLSPDVRSALHGKASRGQADMPSIQASIEAAAGAGRTETLIAGVRSLGVTLAALLRVRALLSEDDDVAIPAEALREALIGGPEDTAAEPGTLDSLDEHIKAAGSSLPSITDRLEARAASHQSRPKFDKSRDGRGSGRGGRGRGRGGWAGSEYGRRSQRNDTQDWGASGDDPSHPFHFRHDDGGRRGRGRGRGGRGGRGGNSRPSGRRSAREDFV